MKGKRYRKYLDTTLLFTMLLLLSTLFTVEVSAQQQDKHVLYINSYTMSFPASIDQYRGLQSVLDTAGISMDAEFMDSKRFPDEANRQSFAKRLSYLLQKSPRYDAIVVSDDDAFRFALQHQHTLFRNIPIFFMGVNDIELGLAQEKNPLVAGLLERPSFEGTLELMLKLYPKHHKIYIVCDHSLTGVNDYADLMTVIPKFKGLKFETIWCDEYTTGNFIEKLLSLDSDIPMLFESAYSNKGRSGIRTFKESVSLVSSHFQGPIFSTWSYGVQSGALGGKVISFFQHGHIVGRMVKRVLEGASMKDMKIVANPPYQYMFNNDMLDRFGIDTSVLPANSVILNKQLSIYEQNKPIVISTLVFIVILIVMIAFLIHSNLQRVKTSRELVLSKNKAEQSDRMKSDFIRNMSHEIKTPLNSIVGFTGLLSSNPEAEKENESYIAVVNDNVKQLMNIIRKVLEISSIENKTDELVLAQTSVCDILHDQYYIYSDTVRMKGVKLFMDDANKSVDCVIQSDAKKLSKIVSYLLENAIKFTSAGEIHIGFYRQRNKMVVIYVKDTGIGISKEQQHIIFGRFVQAEDPLSRKFGGMGLGLAIARENAMLLGGDIFVDSEIGKGSTFFVKLPC